MAQANGFRKTVARKHSKCIKINIFLCFKKKSLETFKIERRKGKRHCGRNVHVRKHPRARAGEREEQPSGASAEFGRPRGMSKPSGALSWARGGASLRSPGELLARH